MKKILQLSKIILMLYFCVPSYSFASPIEYQISFTQTYFHSNFGTRSLEGTFVIDDSVIGSGFENQTYDPYSSEIDLLTDFTVTLNEVTIYDFDLAFTQNIVAPPISTVIATGFYGEVIDIQGGLTIAGTFSEIILGREGNEGEYVDVQQVSSTSAIVVSRGTYQISRVSPVPLPPAIYLFTTGIIALFTIMRKSSI